MPEAAVAPDRVRHLLEAVLALRHNALDLEAALEGTLAGIHPSRRASARNLAHYLALRQTDLRPLQIRLVETGLTSLGVAEAHVMATLTAVLDVLGQLSGHPTPREADDIPVTVGEAGTILEREAAALFGPRPPDRWGRIMVTMPTEAATDARLVETLVAQGMDVMRINCAHDDARTWRAMIDNLRRAEARLGRRCRVSFDLAGPKLRTGPIEPGPQVVRFRPIRDALGEVASPAVVELSADRRGDDGGATSIPVDLAFVEAARPGDEVRLEDARGRDRLLVVRTISETRCTCEADRTGYVTTGTILTLWRGGERVHEGRVGHLPPKEQAITLHARDALVVTDAAVPGEPAVRDEWDRVVAPAHIGCTLPEVFAAVRTGQRVLLDDGKFEGMVREVRPDQFRIEIYRAGAGAAKLKAEKGINFPDTQLRLGALTEKDLEDLRFVVAHGDMVSLSFVRGPEDIQHLYAELDRLGAKDLGVVLKIENRAAFENLPQILMAAMQRPLVGVMVARGDLAVEVGFERLAEVQEEILWLCGAAHVPVIWATQVLESLAKQGVPSRSEVTDAAASVRAECVMLNKGPYVGEAVRFLRDVLRRMGTHAVKRAAMLRRLAVAGAYSLPIRPVDPSAD